MTTAFNSFNFISKKKKSNHVNLNNQLFDAAHCSWFLVVGGCIGGFPVQGRPDEHIPLTSSSRLLSAATSRASGLSGKQVLRQRCNKLGASAGSSILPFILICPFLFLLSFALWPAQGLRFFFISFSQSFTIFFPSGLPPNPRQSMPNQNASHDHPVTFFGYFKRPVN